MTIIFEFNGIPSDMVALPSVFMEPALCACWHQYINHSMDLALKNMNALPGESVPVNKRYGPGIADQTVLVAGEIKTKQNIPYIDSNFRRYEPAVKDLVIGVITMRGGDFYRVSLQPYSKPVRLSQLAFENATKKNKPNLKPGDVVYAKVTSQHRDLETEIECYDSKTGKAAGFGLLKEGNLISVGCGYARKLLFEGSPILEELGNRFVFELAIGANGRVWVKGQDLRTTLIVSERIKAGDY